MLVFYDFIMMSPFFKKDIIIKSPLYSFSETNMPLTSNTEEKSRNFEDLIMGFHLPRFYATVSMTVMT